MCAVPFEEDERDPSIWFLDHSYLENMAHMYKKVNGEHWSRCTVHWNWPRMAGSAAAAVCGISWSFPLTLKHHPSYTAGCIEVLC